MGKSVNQSNLLKMTTPPRREPRMKKSIKLENINFRFGEAVPLFIIAFGIPGQWIISCMDHLPTLLLTGAEEVTWESLRSVARCDHCPSPDTVFSVTLGGRKIGTHINRRKNEHYR